MRLWHKDLIPVLPKNQLTGQWRECCSIAKGIKEGTLNHILVNKVKDYPPEHLYSYGVLVGKEMEKRGISVNPETFLRYFYHYYEEDGIVLAELPQDDIFSGWHNNRYLAQCYFNLQEKFDCGGISLSEWVAVVSFIKDKDIIAKL